MGRGARIWQPEAPGLFDAELPPPAPATDPPAAQAQPRRPVPTDAECRRMEKALERFKAWFLYASLDELRAADPAALAKKYPPIPDWDIAQMIEVRIKFQSRKR